MLIEHNVSSGAAEIVFLTDWHQSDIFKLFPGYPLHFYSEKWYELLKFSVFVKKPTLLAMESLYVPNIILALNADQRSVFVNLTVSLATAAKSISLWTKFTPQGCEMITLASWPPKTTFKNLDWILGWGDIGTNNWYFWFHKRIYVKNKPRISNVGR